MSGETIELLKGYDPKKMQFPAYISQKLDGVPVRLWNKFGSPSDFISAWTRQGEMCMSIPEIVKLAQKLLPVPGSSFVGELYIPGKPFKEISGLARQHSPAPELQLWVFDADPEPGVILPYDRRMRRFMQALDGLQALSPVHLPIRHIPRTTVENDFSVQHTFEFLMKVNPDAEGAVVHSKAKTFQPGKRCWGTQRLKPEPTLDLRVESYEEAVSKTGEPMGMVGRINVEYQRNVLAPSVVGVGPGAMDHDTRRRVWLDYCKPYPRSGPGRRVMPIIEVKYMKDDTYDALRQPTFVRFRPDKTEADVHNV